MVQTRKSYAKRELDRDSSSNKSFKDDVRISVKRVGVDDYINKNLKGLDDTDMTAKPASKYPSRLRKYTPIMRSYVLKSSFSDFFKNREPRTSEWQGNPEIKYTKGGLDIKIYNSVSLGNDILTSGDIIRLSNNTGNVYGQITYLFEENSRKKAEIRVIYPHRKEYIETYEYIIITLKQIFDKIDFSPENGYICNALQEKSGEIVAINPVDRLQRSFYRSKLSMQVCNNNNSLHHAIALLTLSSVPSNLIGRSGEKQEILDFLVPSIKAGHSANSLYICGMPGTGKTATFLHVIDVLQSSEASEKFEFIHINCMKLSKPQELYNTVCREILNKKKLGHNALEEINTYIKSGKKPNSIVLLVDEIDALLNRKQDVLYNLFNWTNMHNSNFIVAGIANTMDLSDKFIHKVSSRMGNKQIVFAPYSRDQLQEIITKRLKDTQAFTQEAILFCAAKIASYSGDARRAFQVCKRAAFLALEQKQKVIGIDHIQKAFKQLFASIYVQVVQSLPIYMKLLLASLCLELKNNNKDTTTPERLCCRLNSYCQTILSMRTLSLKQVEILISRLASLHLILFELDIIKLLVTPDDIIESLKSEPILSKLEAFLQGN